MNVIEKLNSIKSGEMTAKENVESFIKVIDENNEEINAFIELNYENALKQAEAIDKILELSKEILLMDDYYSIKNSEKTINNQREICDLWKEILPAMWW